MGRNGIDSEVLPLFDRPAYPGGRIIFVPGMNTKFSRIVEQAMYVSDVVGGYNVNIIQNYSNGIGLDIGRALLEHLVGAPTEATRDLERFLSYEEEENVRNFIVAFSEGAIITENALKNSAESIQHNTSALGICPGKLIQKSSAINTLNIANKSMIRDPIPHLDAIGGIFSYLRRNESSCNVIYEASHPDADFFDHDLTSPAYRPHIIEGFKEFQNKGVQN